MVGGSSDKAAEGGGEAQFGGVGSKAVDGPFVFKGRRVGVVKRPSAAEERVVLVVLVRWRRRRRSW